MAGLLDGLVKGLASLAPQDDPDIKLFNTQTRIKELSEQEDGIFTTLGKRLYAENGSDAYPETAAQLAELAAKKAEATEALAQLQAEKAAREQAAAAAAAAQRAAAARYTCPSCGEVNPEGTSFCQNCGTRLPGESKRFCIGCGAELAAGMRFCGECGAKQE